MRHHMRLSDSAILGLLVSRLGGDVTLTQTDMAALDLTSTLTRHDKEDGSVRFVLEKPESDNTTILPLTARSSTDRLDNYELKALGLAHVLKDRAGTLAVKAVFGSHGVTNFSEMLHKPELVRAVIDDLDKALTHEIARTDCR